MTTLNALRMSQQNFRASMEEIDKSPNLDITEGTIRLLSGQMLEAVSGMSEEKLKELDFDTLSKHAAVRRTDGWCKFSGRLYDKTI